MKKSKAIFLLLAFLAVVCMIGISAGLAEGSVLTILISIILFVVILGYGFTLKKKYRENHWL
ncbi:hypothetical protein ERX27_01580 [Macrococcus brunensis]|uniref:YlaF family protein n=1 Tax=Macrococcus brunensis TaxID=198483 RepID=A0A4R6BG02_9STAP|nr:YlaF family protein [Macrococcus brunensis]TDL98811.1 hypothetical protein ERX27_01580 [Macrococcus brunensis]ULG72761.1 YlaF family protein [Macrococcus brunensis]ULG75010.1 YlaF family protein [Macrococcus brunensis]